MSDDASGEHAWLMPSQPKTRDLPRRAHEISRAGRYVWQLAYFIIEADRGRDVQCMAEGQSVIRARRAVCGTNSPKDSGPITVSRVPGRRRLLVDAAWKRIFTSSGQAGSVFTLAQHCSALRCSAVLLLNAYAFAGGNERSSFRSAVCTATRCVELWACALFSCNLHVECRSTRFFF